MTSTSKYSFDNWLKSQFQEKYIHDPQLLLDIATGKITDTREILNPQYNSEFREKLIAWVKNHPTYCRPEMVRIITDETLIAAAPTFLGAGGQNSVWALCHHLFVKRFVRSDADDPVKNELFHQSFIVNDEDLYELTNLPRIPFKVQHPNKALNVNKNFGKYTAKTNKVPQKFPNYIDLYEGMFAGMLLVGAMDIPTRQYLYEMKIPYITITHKDNLIRAVLCPSYNQDIPMEEGYGKIDINFLIPGMILAYLKFWDWFREHQDELDHLVASFIRVTLDDWKESLEGDELRATEGLFSGGNGKNAIRTAVEDKPDIHKIEMAHSALFQFMDYGHSSNQFNAVITAGRRLATGNFDWSLEDTNKYLDELIAQRPTDNTKTMVFIEELTKAMVQFKIFRQEYDMYVDTEMFTVTEDEVKALIEEIMEVE
jgi:hypothetical protein